MNTKKINTKKINTKKMNTKINIHKSSKLYSFTRKKVKYTSNRNTTKLTKLKGGANNPVLNEAAEAKAQKQADKLKKTQELEDKKKKKQELEDKLSKDFESLEDPPSIFKIILQYTKLVIGLPKLFFLKLIWFIMHAPEYNSYKDYKDSKEPFYISSSTLYTLFSILKKNSGNIKKIIVVARDHVKTITDTNIKQIFEPFLTDEVTEFIETNLKNGIVLYLNFFKRFFENHKLAINKLELLAVECFKQNVNHFITLLRLDEGALSMYFDIDNGDTGNKPTSNGTTGNKPTSNTSTEEEVEVSTTLFNGGGKGSNHTKANLKNDKYIKEELNKIIELNLDLISKLIGNILYISCVSTHPHSSQPSKPSPPPQSNQPPANPPQPPQPPQSTQSTLSPQSHITITVALPGSHGAPGFQSVPVPHTIQEVQPQALSTQLMAPAQQAPPRTPTQQALAQPTAHQATAQQAPSTPAQQATAQTQPNTSSISQSQPPEKTLAELQAQLKAGKNETERLKLESERLKAQAEAQSEAEAKEEAAQKKAEAEKAERLEAEKAKAKAKANNQQQQKLEAEAKAEAERKKAKAQEQAQEPVSQKEAQELDLEVVNQETTVSQSPVSQEPVSQEPVSQEPEAVIQETPQVNQAQAQAQLEAQPQAANQPLANQPPANQTPANQTPAIQTPTIESVVGGSRNHKKTKTKKYKHKHKKSRQNKNSKFKTYKHKKTNKHKKASISKTIKNKKTLH